MTTRRGFFSALAAMIAGATLDPEKLLWEPGKIFYSIPARSPGNTLITVAEMDRFFLEALQRNLRIHIDLIPTIYRERRMIAIHDPDGYVRPVLINRRFIRA